jgi:hypothetical protein
MTYVTIMKSADVSNAVNKLIAKRRFCTDLRVPAVPVTWKADEGFSGLTPSHVHCTAKTRLGRLAAARGRVVPSSRATELRTAHCGAQT